MGKKVNRLSGLEIDEVSLVDRGANQHASVELFKNLDGDEMESDHESDDQGSLFSKLVNKVLDLDLTTSSRDDGTMSEVGKMTPGTQMPYDQMQEGYPEMGPSNEMGGPGGEPHPDEMMMEEEVEAGPPLPQEVIDYIADLEDQLAELTGDPMDEEVQQPQEEEMFGKNFEHDEIAFLSELAKSLQDEEDHTHIAKAQEMVHKANARAEEAERIAKVERDHRLNQEYVAKARSFSNLPVNAQEFGPILKRLHESMDEGDVEVIEKALRTANESVSNFFGEIGKRGDNAFMSDRLDSVAKNITDSDPSVTLEQARARALEQDPSLYDEFLQDQGRF